MSELSAYIAVSSCVRDRRVLVVHPAGPEGPRKLVEWGASRVLVVGDRVAAEPGISVRSAGTRLPLQKGSVDLVLCLDAVDQFDDAGRSELLSELARVRRKSGLVVIRVARDGTEGETALDGGPLEHSVPFWTLRDEMEQVFGAVTVVSQVPWTGHSFAPVVDAANDEDEAIDPPLSFREDLLEDAPLASHFLCLAGARAAREELASTCVLVPREGRALADDGPEHPAAAEELELLRDELAIRAARAAAAESRVRALENELDASLAPESHLPEASSRDELAAHCDQLRAERDEGLAQLRDERARASALAQECTRLRSRAPSIPTREAEGSGYPPDNSEAARDSQEELRQAEFAILEAALATRDSALVLAEERSMRLESLLEATRDELETTRAEGERKLQALRAIEGELERARVRVTALWERCTRAELAYERLHELHTETRETPATLEDLPALADSPDPVNPEVLARDWQQRIISLLAQRVELATRMTELESQARSWRIRASVVEAMLLSPVVGDMGATATDQLIVSKRASPGDLGDPRLESWSAAVEAATRTICDQMAAVWAEEAGADGSETATEAGAEPVGRHAWPGLQLDGFVEPQFSDEPLPGVGSAASAGAMKAAPDAPVEQEIDAHLSQAISRDPQSAGAERKGVDPELLAEATLSQRVEALRDACAAALLDRNRARQASRQWEQAWQAERDRHVRLLEELETLRGSLVIERAARLVTQRDNADMRVELRSAADVPALDAESGPEGEGELLGDQQMTGSS